MKKFTEKSIPKKCQTEIKSGVYAEFDQSGALTHYGLYREGTEPESHYIEFNYDQVTALVTEYKRIDFKANSYSTLTKNQQLLIWVKEWLQKIPQPPLECSFCAKQQDDVKKLIAGPYHYICNECVELCQEIISDSGGKA